MKDKIFLKKQAELLEKMKKIKKQDIHTMINEASKFFGNPILAHDMEYKLVANAENVVTDDPIWNEFVTTGTNSFDRLEFYKDESFLEEAANAENVTYLFSKKLKYNRIFGKIFDSNHIQIGGACITACNKPFDDDSLKLFGFFCKIFSEKLRKIDFFQKHGQEYMDTLVGELIENRIKDKSLYTAHVESLYINLKPNLYLAVADISKTNSTCNEIREILKKTYPKFKYVIYLNYIVIIISSDETLLNSNKQLSKLNTIFQQNNIYVGISSCFQNLFEMQKYYKQALDALNYGINNNAEQWIFEYNDLD